MRDDEAITIVAHFRDAEDEQVVLGDIIGHPDQAPFYIEAGFTSEHFADHRNRRIWRAVTELQADNIEPDFPAIWQLLRAAGEAEEIGAGYVTGLVDGIPRQSAENITARRRRLETLARCRRAHYLGISFRASLAEDPDRINNGFLGAHLAELEAIQRGDTDRACPLQDDVQILTMPAPRFIVDGILPETSLACLFGEPGIGKTFLGIDLAFSVAIGRPFFGAPAGHGVGPVVYVVSEGAAAMRERVSAWKLAHGVVLDDPSGVLFWSGAVPLLDAAAVSHFIASVKPRAPRLVVLDTLARCMVGGDENSARDMGLAVAAADRIRVALDAAVLLVHHQNKNGGTERGSSALRGACDVMLQLTRTDDALRLESSKAKDSEPFAPIDLKLVPAYPGAPSCVLRPLADVPATEELTDAQGKVWHAMTVLFSETGATSAELQEAVPGMHRVTYFRARAALKEKGLIEERLKRWYPTGRKPVASSSARVAEHARPELREVAR